MPKKEPPTIMLQQVIDFIRVKLKDMTQAELASKCDVEQGNISRWLNNKQSPDFNKLSKLLFVLGVRLVFPGEDAYPTTEIDRQVHRKLRREIPDNMIPFMAERAFPGWSEAQRETTLRGVLEGSIPLTVGLYYAIANAVLGDRPGEQLDRTATELMTGIVATAGVNETTQKQYPDKPKKKAPRAKAQPPEADLSRLAPASGRIQEADAAYETRRTANGGTNPRK